MIDINYFRNKLELLAQIAILHKPALTYKIDDPEFVSSANIYVTRMTISNQADHEISATLSDESQWWLYYNNHLESSGDGWNNLIDALFGNFPGWFTDRIQKKEFYNSKPFMIIYNTYKFPVDMILSCETKSEIQDILKTLNYQNVDYDVDVVNLITGQKIKLKSQT